MKRVLFFLGNTKAGGTERVVCNLANFLAEKNYCVEILQYYPSECYYDLSSKVVRKSVNEICDKSLVLNRMIAIRRYVKQNSDIVLSFMTVFNIIMLASMFGSKIPIIVSERSDPKYAPKSVVKRLLRTLLYPCATKIVCQTQTAKSFLGKKIQKKCCVIYNPVDLGSKVGYALQQEKRHEIVSVGRLIPVKNHKLLISAFRRFHETHQDYRLRIFGQGQLLDELIKYCEKLKIEEYVSFEGVVKDVPANISFAEMFVLSSDYEGMPNSLLEAMCIGLPVISTKVAGAVDLIDGSNGILIDINSEKQLENAICKVADDEELRYKIASKATEIFNVLNPNSIVPIWRRMIDEIIE